MSESNKHNDGMQDYIDLLEEMAKRDRESSPTEGIEDIMAEYSDSPSAPPVKKSDNFQDVSSHSPAKQSFFKKLSDKFNALPKKKKIIVSAIAIFLAVVITFTGVAGVFVAHKFGLLGDNFKDDDDIIYDEGTFEDIELDFGSAGFKQALIDWATVGNDQHMTSKNVINVLLIGADSRNGTNSGNTDVMMLVSLNKKTKQLNLVSFLRDSYLYVEGENNSYCTKLNAAFSMGGPNTLIKTIENNYKIDIDNYVMVNFESFAAIVDAMGGITVDVQEYEANHSNSLLGGDMPYGEDVTLNGTQALYFCRIRNCDADGDVSRTRRQRQVIDAIIDKVKNASIKDLNKYIDILLPYVDTGYSKTQILSLGIKALTGKWYSYERNQLQMPDEECRTSGSANAWIWVVDYQLAAHKLQNALYGMTNIKIEEGRTSLIDVYRGANYTGSYSNSIVSPTENDVTTLPQTTEGTTAAVTEPSTVPDTTEEFSEIETTVEDIPLDTEPVDTTFEEIPDTSAEPEPTEVTEAPETQEPATEPPVTEVQ